jgi:pimeloyl-ACP methyl ester carboxylesterase
MRSTARARTRARAWARRGVTVVVLAALVAVLVPTAGATPAGAVSPPSITWRPCGDRFQCGTLAVPLDEAHPERTVDLSVVRRRAADPGVRIGTLVVNPGGPGAPSVAFVRATAASLPEPILERFDIVGVDPRGVGNSEPVQCSQSLDPFFDQSFEPRTSAARAALVAHATAIAQQCAAHVGDLLAHMSTADAVNDLERLREALGEHRLSFLGYSYGTFLGASYAQAHPRRVRSFVLDGPVDSSMTASQVTLSQARGFERALDDFLADCSAHPGCAFHHRGDAEDAYDALRDRAARSPLPTVGSGGRTVNLTRLDAAVLQTLYLGRSAWASLADALSDAEHGDASTLLAGADTFVGRDVDGADDHVLEAFWAVSCLDGPVVPGASAAEELEQRTIDVAPRLGAFIVNNSLPCSVWPVPPVPPPGPLRAAGAPPILVIGTTRDPATPLPQARAMANALERGRLLVAVGEQHTAFGQGSDCVDGAVTRYLVDRELPRPGTRC